MRCKRETALVQYHSPAQMIEVCIATIQTIYKYKHREALSNYRLKSAHPPLSKPVFEDHDTCFACNSSQAEMRTNRKLKTSLGSGKQSACRSICSSQARNIPSNNTTSSH